MVLTHFDYALWALCKSMELILVGLIFRGRLLSEWFWLVAYCVIQLTTDAVGFYALVRSEYKLSFNSFEYKLFYYSFWHGALFLLIAQVGILLTIYSFTFQSVTWAPKRIRLIIIVVSLLFIGAVIRSSTGVMHLPATLPNIIIAANRMLAMGFAALFVISIALAVWLGLKWDTRYLLVDAGFCLTSIVSICWYGLLYLHPHWHPELRDMANRLSYPITLSLWIAAFVPKPQTRKLSPDLQIDKKQDGESILPIVFTLDMEKHIARSIRIRN